MICFVKLRRFQRNEKLSPAVVFSEAFRNPRTEVVTCFRAGPDWFEVAFCV